jgi:uncharacterized protein (TIGR02147 family)
MTRALQVNVYQYLDYRAFLRDAYEDLKQRQRGFSYRWFARRAGMSSPNFLKLVIEGQRNLTAQSAERFAAALGLSTQESAFFRDLVSFNQATTAAEKNDRFERIGAYRAHRAVRKLERTTFEYLSRWYYPAIRELVSCPGFREEPEWIARQLSPAISAQQARKAIEVLLNLGVLERGEGGELRQGDALLSTGPEVRSLAVGNFHRQMMERAAQAIETVDPSRREISGVTVALSAKGFEMFKAKIQKLRAELLELSAEEAAPTRVVQFNFQAFPLAEIEDEENDHD